MKAAPTILTDALLKEALASRATGPSTSAELLQDVLVVIRSTTQGSGWALELPRASRSVLVLVVGLLLVSALIGSALMAGAYHAARVAPLAPQGDRDIVFVQWRYTWNGATDAYGAATPTIADPRILSVRGTGGEPSLLAPVPGFGGRALVGTGVNGPMARWSPDGSRIAFRMLFNEPGIYVMDRDGSDLRRITDLAEPYVQPEWGLWDSAFAWSPDGTRIAFAYPAHASGPGWTRPSSIYAVDVDDGRVAPLVGPNANGSAIAPIAWSPDGRKLAFGRIAGHLRYTTNSLSVIDFDGSNEVRLVELHAVDLGPLAWSPEGSRIEFLRDFDGSDGGGLWTVNVDGTGLHVVAPGPWAPSTEVSAVYDWGGVWSPDGRWLAQPREGGIGILATDGSDYRRIGIGDHNGVEHIRWSPDGSQLVFMDEVDESTARAGTWDPPSIYVINADGTGLRWLADGEYPDWAR